MPWRRLSELLGLTKGGTVRGALQSLWGKIGSGQGASGVAFTIAVISLSAKMAKADGVAVQVEADAFERQFRVPHDDMDDVRRLFDLAKQDVAGYQAYAEQIGRLLANEPALRADVLECLFHIAAADGILHTSEQAFLEVVAAKLAIGAADFSRMRALFVHDPGSPYEVLGASPADSDDSLRARYRQLAKEHHPDRLLAHGVPKEFVTIAERKLVAINAAWSAIRKERGL